MVVPGKGGGMYMGSWSVPRIPMVAVGVLME